MFPTDKLMSIKNNDKYDNFKIDAIRLVVWDPHRESAKEGLQDEVDRPCQNEMINLKINTPP